MEIKSSGLSVWSDRVQENLRDHALIQVAQNELMDDSVRNMRKNTIETMKNTNEILTLISVMEKHGDL